MRRTIDETLEALHRQVRAWSEGAAADIRVMVYPPEQEPTMLERLPSFSEALNKEGLTIDLVDIGQRFREAMEGAPARLTGVRALEAEAADQAVNDFSRLAHRTVEETLESPLPDGAVCRVLSNIGALATLVSYSAITNDYSGSTDRQVPPTVMAFPGDADERSLNLLGLRVDTNYRVARI